MSDHSGLSSTKKSSCEPESPLMFSLTKFSPTDSTALLLGYKTPTFPGCIGVETTLCLVLRNAIMVPPPPFVISGIPEWIVLSLTESMKRTPHTHCLNSCCTNGGYSQVWSGKESPKLTFLPPFYLLVPPLGKHTRKQLMTEVPIWGSTKRSASYNICQSRDGQTVLWGGVSRISWYCSE